MHNFKKALSRAGIFILLIVIVTAPLIYAYFHQTCYYYQDNDIRDEMAGQIDTLIVGASEGMRGIMPVMFNERMDTCAYNLSGAMMTLTGRYELLKAELERNPVKTVVLELSYDTLVRDRSKEGPEGDLQVLGRWSTPWQRIHYLMTAFTVDELPRVFYDTLDRGVLSAKFALGMETPLTGNETYASAGYVKTSANNMRRTDAEYQQAYHTVPWPNEILPENVEILQKISDLCREHQVEVYMVTVPISKYAILQHDGMQTLHDYYVDFAEKNGWKYFDLNLLQDRDTLFTEEEAYNDDVHLSAIGAYYTTEQIIQLIQMSRNEEDTSALFFPSFDALNAHYGFE